MAFTKHVNDTDNYQFDFSDPLDTDGGETLQNPSVDVLKKKEDSDGNVTWDDVTSEFGSLSPSVTGTNSEKVTFSLNARTDTSEQEDSPYLVYCEASTSTNRVLADTNGLITIKTGDKAE